MKFLGDFLAVVTTLLIVPPFFLGFATVAALPFSLFGYGKRSPSRPKQKFSQEDFHMGNVLEYPTTANGSRYRYVNFRKAA